MTNKPIGYDLGKENNENTTGIKMIQFGTYPQTIASSDIIETLRPSAGNRYTDDLGNEYVKIKADPYRDIFSNDPYNFSNGDEVVRDEEYYFKVEPISWIVLREDDTKKMLLAEKIVDSKLFLEKGFVGPARTDGFPNTYAGVDKAFPNTWEYSTLRAWLNSLHNYAKCGFINKAFDDASSIVRVKLHNGPDSSKVKRPMVYSWAFQKDTSDRVFCLSVEEACQKPFSNNVSDCDKTSVAKGFMPRAAVVTDFAIATGVRPCYRSDGVAIGWWWLRSPGDPDCHESSDYGRRVLVTQKRSCDITEDGHICQRGSVVDGYEEDTCDGSANGIRPALYLKK